jgi:hypothetical protein
MNKSTLVAIMLVAMLASATPVAASDTEVSVGLKLWYNTWRETVKAPSGSEQKFDNGAELMAGPSLDVRYRKDWFASITYLTSLGDYGSSDWFASGDKMRFERTDTDLQAGFLLRDQLNDVTVGFFAAYKAIDAPASYTNGAAGLNEYGIGTWKLTGPGFGMIAEKRLEKATVLFGNAALYFLEQEFTFSSGGVERCNTHGFSAGFGIVHTFMKKIAADVGVKYQRFTGEMVNNSEVTDTFYGLIAGIAYMF